MKSDIQDIACVYLMYCEAKSAWKIGFTTNHPDARRKSIQQSNCWGEKLEITLIKYRECKNSSIAQEMESRLLQDGHRHQNGITGAEWFSELTVLQEDFFFHTPSDGALTWRDIAIHQDKEIRVLRKQLDWTINSSEESREFSNAWLLGSLHTLIDTSNGTVEELARAFENIKSQLQNER
ncbi:MAG: GIY-YIG nuclease family protein [Bacteroidota bacterium]